MRTFRLGRPGRVLAQSLLVATVGAAALATTAGASGPGRHVMTDTKPAWTAAVNPSTAVAPATGLSARVWLTPRNAAQLDAAATAVSDPASPQYGQFISEADYRAQYAPTSDQVSQVSQWLTGAGLSVVSVGPDNHFIAVSGSAASIESAFGTSLAHYVVSGKVERAPTTDLSVPDSVAGLVQAVSGLTTLGHRMTPGDFGAPDAFVPGTPCSDFYGQKKANTLPRYHGKTLPINVCGYTTTQLRGAYGVTASRRAGEGATVAITDAYDAPQLESDTDTYSRLHGDRPFAPRQFRDLSVPEDASTSDDCGGNGWYGEEALDVEAVHGMAPAANVLYYGAASCNDDDLQAQLAQVVADNKASIVTNSWGGPSFVVMDGVLYPQLDPDLVNAYETIFKQGALQGIGFYFSSGDDGDELADAGYVHPDFPTGDPWVTSVGGTSIAIDRRNQRVFETGWGTTLYSLAADGRSWVRPGAFHGGAGGGFSQVFNRPWYQLGVVPGNTTGRAVPDVAMESDPTTGMLVGETQSFSLPSRFGPAGVHYGEYRIGGTSLGSPLMAGVQAVAEGSHRIGFANPRIYSLARGPFLSSGHGQSPFYDETPQGDPANVRADYVNGINASDGVTFSLRTFDEDSSLVTRPGWDDVTGVGSVTESYIDQVASGWRQ
jgi:subtilase family serine protease